MKKSSWKTICEIQVDTSSDCPLFAFKSVLPKKDMIELLKLLIDNETKVFSGVN